MKINVIYEEKLHLDAHKAFNLTLQWLRSQYKAKIKTSTPPTFIEAKQGTMMTNTGHDPNWKKRIIINLYTLEGKQTLVRVEAIPLARTVFRIEKLKQSWYEGLFSHLFSLLRTYSNSSKQEKSEESDFIQGEKIKYCTYCGNKLEENVKICPNCGIQLR